MAGHARKIAAIVFCLTLCTGLAALPQYFAG